MDITKFTIGTPVIIKTDDDIYDSYISAITLSDENFVYFKSGSIRTTLLDKLKAVSQGTGNKLDVSGGLIKGTLKVTDNIYVGVEKVLTGSALVPKKNLPAGVSFNDVLTSGENSIYAVPGGHSDLPGFPTGAQGYGILVTFNPREATSASNWWEVAQIYIADIPSTNGVFVRNRLNEYWVKLTGTTVSPVQ